MSDRIVGLCRFSFVGRGDWVRFRGMPHGAIPEDLLAEQVAELYRPERLERRFHAFEAMCLPSIGAQTDRDFHFLILTSPQMPAPWLERLRAAVAKVPMAEVIVSDAPSVGLGFSARLQQIRDEEPGRDIVQFRLDDDDALAINFIAKLRGHVARLSDLRSYAVSFRRNMAVTLYPAAEHAFWGFDLPFSSVGLAIKPPLEGTVFSYGHFGAQQRLTHILDTTQMGGLVVKWPSDSRAPNLDRMKSHFTALDRAEARPLLERYFPFTQHIDFERLRVLAEPADA